MFVRQQKPNKLKLGYIHQRGLSLLYSTPRVSVIRVKMMKMDARNGVGAMMVAMILGDVL